MSTSIDKEIQELEQKLLILKQQKKSIDESKSGINDDIDRALFNKYVFDQVSSNILFTMFDKFKINIIEMNNTYYIKIEKTLIELDYIFNPEGAMKKGGVRVNGINEIIRFINPLLNMQDGALGKTCRHNNGNSGGCCNTDALMPRHGSHQISVLLRYLYEKTKLLEEEIGKLKSKSNSGEKTFNSVY